MRAAAGICFLLNVSALDDFNDRKTELLRKLPVPAVVSRNRHNGTRAVAGKHVIRDPDRHLGAVYRVDGIRAREYAGFILGQIRTLQVAFTCSLILISLHRIALFGCRNFVHEVMLRCQDAVACPEQRIRTSGEHLQMTLIPFNVKTNLGARGFADPVALHILQAFAPVQFVQILQQAIRIFGNAQDPLAHRLAYDRMASAFALAVDDLFVRQHGAERFAPVHRNLGHIGQAAFIELDKDPLRPFVIFRIGGADLAVPVIREPEGFDLAAERIDILHGELPWMFARVHRILLCREAKGVPSHRMKHVVSAHPLVAGHDVRCRVPPGDLRAGLRPMGTETYPARKISVWTRCLPF